jgi:purine-nucleoside phosphorylase
MDFQDALLTPRQYFQFLAQKGEFPPSYKPPEIVMFVFQKAALQHILAQHTHQKGKSFLSKMAFLDKAPIAVCGGFGVGAPALAIKLEELIAWGVKRFISVGTCAVLTSDVKMHSQVIATKACGIDGVSKYYVDAGEEIEADQDLKNLYLSYAMKEGVSLRPVKVMTTDLLFGTSKRHVDDYTKAHADILDMECAAFYAICKKRKVSALSLFTTSDSLAEEDWIPGFDSDTTASELKKLVDLSLRFCFECL